jgi:uracil-DNA glycosylase
VDGRDQLRRYLEQRREAGEREFFLDGMTVEDALRLVGDRSVASQVEPPDVPPPSADAADLGTADWRTVLAGTEPRQADPVVRPRVPTGAPLTARTPGDEPPTPMAG